MLRECEVPSNATNPVTNWFNQFDGSFIRPCPKIAKANKLERIHRERAVDVIQRFEEIQELLFTLVDCELISETELVESMKDCKCRETIAKNVDNLLSVAALRLDKEFQDHVASIQKEFTTDSTINTDYKDYIETGDFSINPEISVTSEFVGLFVYREEGLSVLGFDQKTLPNEAVMHIERVIEFMSYHGCYRTVCPELCDYDWVVCTILGDMSEHHVTQKRIKRWLKEWRCSGLLPADAISIMHEVCSDDEEYFVEQLHYVLDVVRYVDMRWFPIKDSHNYEHIEESLIYFTKQYKKTGNKDYIGLCSICNICIKYLKKQVLPLKEVGDLPLGSGRMVCTDFDNSFETLLRSFSKSLNYEQSRVQINCRKDIENIKQIMTVDVALSILISLGG